MKNTFIYLISIIILVMLAGANFLSATTACDGIAIFQIFNDTLANPAGTFPEPGIDDLSGCPTDLYMGTPFDTLEHILFPDTLVWPDIMISALASSYPATAVVTGSEYFNSGGVDASVTCPPMYAPDCCKSGIYAKARMFDASSGEYSPWVDINTTDMFYISYVPPNGTFLQVSLCNFKSRDLGQLMGFDCGVDSLILYIWDCNGDDVDVTAGEFAVWYGTFPNGDALRTNEIYLGQYDPTNIGEQGELPAKYALEQNSPNPFNAATTIEYSLPEDADVRITISNMLGETVRTLTDGNQTAGTRQVVWDGLDDDRNPLPSGVYFYSIQANDFSAKRRAILMK